MTDYISREDALIVVCEGCNIDFDKEPCEPSDCTIRGFIRSIPAADVRPVVRGEIEEDENTYLWCSECGCNITLSAYTMPNGNLILRPNFCPNCGARMEEQT